MSQFEEQPLVNRGIEDILAAHPEVREVMLRSIVHVAATLLIQEQGERGLNFVRRLPEILPS